MKKFIYYFTSFVFLLALTACSHDEAGEFDNLDELENIGVPFYGKDTISFTLTLEDGMRTRSRFDDSKTHFLWDEGDEISVFDGIDNCRFILSKGAGTTSGRFSGVASFADNYTFVYPYTESAKLLDNGDVEGIVLPSEQTATAGSYDPKAILMMEKSASMSSYSFFNAISCMKFQTDFNCSKAMLCPINNNMSLAGKGILTWNDGVPIIDFSKSVEKSYIISLSGNILAGQTYYLIIPPGTLSGGYNLTFVSSEDGKVYKRKASKDISFVRNKIVNFGSFSKDATYWIDFEQGTVTDEQEVDLGLTIMQDGKNYKVIFANSNLTVHGLAANETDFGDYFAWAATEPWCTDYEYTSGDTFIASTWLYGKEEDGYTKSYISSYDGNVLKDSDDAARDILGGKWQIPTIEILNLLSGCACEWTTINNVAGYKFTNNGNSIFLPAAGQFDKNMYCESVGVSGYYRVNSTNGDKNSDYFVLQSNGITQVSDNWRKGCTIRPVRLEEITTE